MSAEQIYIRMSARKARLVVEAVKGLPIQAALTQLEWLPQRAAQQVGKVLKQAVANANLIWGVKASDLKIKAIEVGEGPVLKRWRAVSRGRAHRINKRTCHIRVTVELKQKGSKSGPKS